MKSVKRIFLGLMLAFATILLAACGAKSDNGIYVFEPNSADASKMLPSDFQSLVGDDFSVKVSISIQDDKAQYKSETDFGGETSDYEFEGEVDQKTKTMRFDEEGMEIELSYEINGDVLTIKSIENSMFDDDALFSNYLKFAKFKKVQ